MLLYEGKGSVLTIILWVEVHTGLFGFSEKIPGARGEMHKCVLILCGGAMGFMDVRASGAGTISDKPVIKLGLHLQPSVALALAGSRLRQISVLPRLTSVYQSLIDKILSEEHGWTLFKRLNLAGTLQPSGKRLNTLAPTDRST